MEFVLMAQAKNEPNPMGYLPQPVLDMRHIAKMSAMVVEGGMASGEPAVVFWVSDTPEGNPQGSGFGPSFVFATSLDKFMMAASGLAGMAETQFGWKRPEGHATMMPPDKATRKVLLETIKKELEEWDD